MKKNMKAILSLFLVLVFTLQIPGMLAVAEPETDITGEEALIYELYLQSGSGGRGKRKTHPR